MKKIINILTLFLLILPLISFSQSNYYYYYKENKIYLNLDKSYLFLSTKNDFQETSIENQDFKPFELKLENVSVNGGINKWTELEFETEPSNIEYYQKINTLKNNNKIDVVLPSFTSSEGERVGLSSFLYVKLKQSSDINLLQSVAQDKNVTIIEQNQFMPLWYTLKCTKSTIENSLEIANYFFETGLFFASIPDLLTYNDVTCSNDPFFTDQWGLKNTGQNGGTSGIDINACDAWNITEGDVNITIAVLDHGIEMDHPDINNLHPLSFDTESLSSPSLVLGDHGTACAGIIGADKDNNEGVTGIAPTCRIMSISNSLAGTPNSRIRRADGINWAWQNGADIISNSWMSGVQYQVIDDAIENAILNGRNGLGTIIVFSSGNTNSSVNYPANVNEEILAVGAMSPCAERKNPSSCDGENWWGSSFGVELDIVAPGVLIPTTDRQGSAGYNPTYETNPDYDNYLDYFSKFNGTSSACPHVAGVAGLILSINPYLSGEHVRDIIESTAQKVGGYNYQYTPDRPNGTWDDEMGYGLVDAFAAVQLAQELYSPTLDLYTKDGHDDLGLEPNESEGVMWTSPDIWVRNQPDGIEEHQNPEYNESNPVYVYVRVINKSEQTSSGSEQLTLNWAKASTALEWDLNWNGNLTHPDPPHPKMGDLVSIVNIPVITAGSEAILEIPWMLPNPADYEGINPEPWHFCLLSRIVTSSDPMATPEGVSVNSNTRNNNNIAWKNITITGGKNVRNPGGVVALGNIFQEPTTFDIEFKVPQPCVWPSILDVAEVKIKLDPLSYQIWKAGGKQCQNLTELKANQFLVTGDPAILRNMTYQVGQFSTLFVGFNFLTQYVDVPKEIYEYLVTQRRSSDQMVIGGELYIIHKPPREVNDAFDADAGADKSISKNESVLINAENIGEEAEYNWYDMEDSLIYSGTSLNVTLDSTTNYKLEVLAVTDGYKDYDEVTVNVKQYEITGIAPNPANDLITVNYDVVGVSSAYLMIIGINNGTSNNYILDTSIFETTIDISSYQFGFFTVALFCDGEIVDAKTLLKD